ncbi:bone morphogenetic protein 1-like [Amphiura filiformis]|uniref:bone morphogenetic protein 1-like n=1 Tax=Amphiura filiformis TaxID=82378 RepID=UPI003B218494
MSAVKICGLEQYNLSFSAIVNLTSPFYPSIYPENWECLWFITTIDDGFPVFTVIEMDTEKYNDPLHVGYGHNITDQSTLLELFGEFEKSVIWFRVQTLWMRFETNHRTGGRGFLIHMALQTEYECNSTGYQCESGLVCISANFVCDGYTQCIDVAPENDELQCHLCGEENIQISANLISAINLTSPLYPKPYPTEIVCEWLVTTTDGGTTRIRFIYFDTKLDQHYFEVGFGATPSPETSVYRHSGQNMPKTVAVDGSEMWIEFSSDHEKSLSGFLVLLEWAPMNCKCTKILQSVFPLRIQYMYS